MQFYYLDEQQLHTLALSIKILNSQSKSQMGNLYNLFRFQNSVISKKEKKALRTLLCRTIHENFLWLGIRQIKKPTAFGGILFNCFFHNLYFNIQINGVSHNDAFQKLQLVIKFSQDDSVSQLNLKRAKKSLDTEILLVLEKKKRNNRIPQERYQKQLSFVAFQFLYQKIQLQLAMAFNRIINFVFYKISKGQRINSSSNQENQNSGLFFKYASQIQIILTKKIQNKPKKDTYKILSNITGKKQARSKNQLQSQTEQRTQQILVLFKHFVIDISNSYAGLKCTMIDFPDQIKKLLKNIVPNNEETINQQNMVQQMLGNRPLIVMPVNIDRSQQVEPNNSRVVSQLNNDEMQADFDGRSIDYMPYNMEFQNYDPFSDSEHVQENKQTLEEKMEDDIEQLQQLVRLFILKPRKYVEMRLIDQQIQTRKECCIFDNCPFNEKNQNQSNHEEKMQVQQNLQFEAKTNQKINPLWVQFVSSSELFENHKNHRNPTNKKLQQM